MSKDIAIHDNVDIIKIATNELIEKWLEYERANNASENTCATYRRGLIVFVSWLIDNDTATPSPATIQAFKLDLASRYSAQTVNLRLSAVRSFYRYLVSHGLALYNPASDVKGAKRPNSRTHKRDALSNAEVVAVLATCNDSTMDGARDSAILHLMAFCGLRTVEINRANIGNLKTVSDRLVLEVQGKGRTSADDMVVIPQAVQAALMKWFAYRTKISKGQADPLFVSLSRRSYGKRLSTASIREMVKARFDDAGVIGFNKSTHSLRHSAITNAIRHGASPMQVQAMARHKSFDTTLSYVHEVSRVDNPAEDLIDYGAPR